MDGVLTLVDEKPKDVTERIKTLEDALGELGDSHSFVKEYKDICNDWRSADLMAYLKLRIICAALNEGWQPKFTEDERRYYPWFCQYTKTELEVMSEEDKKNLVMVETGDYDTEYAGIVYTNSYNAPSYTYANVGSYLCFKNSDLAVFCGKQFISLWADYLLRRK